MPCGIDCPETCPPPYRQGLAPSLSAPHLSSNPWFHATARLVLRPIGKRSDVPLEELEVHEITRIDDGLLLPWLDLYELSFLPSEKALVSTFLAILNESSRPRKEGLHLLAAVDSAGHLTGMAACQRFPQHNAALLWYLAIG